jgi:uncharacterized membrane protein YfhO
LDIDKVVVLEGLSALPADDCQKSTLANELPVPEQISIQADEANPNQLEIHLSAKTPAWLVLSDVWYPGWRARVDGETVQLLRANYLFRALRVPAGEHQISLSYQPLSFWGGAALSLFSLLLAGFIFIRLRQSGKSLDFSTIEGK